MKALIVAVAVLIATGTLMIMPGSTTPASADGGYCMGLESQAPDGAPEEPFATLANLPDTGVTFDFVEACDAHDACYYDGSAVGQTPAGWVADRFSCDQRFFAATQDACQDSFESFKQLLTCRGVSAAYYKAMRLAGFVFYNYNTFF